MSSSISIALAEGGHPEPDEPLWNVTYIGSSTNISFICSSGGQYK